MDPVVDALREGRVLFEGGSSLALGASIRDAEAALGIDPERPKNRWTEALAAKQPLPFAADAAKGSGCFAALAESWLFERGFLWFKKGRHAGELIFHDDALIRILGPDDAWTDEGAAWSPEMFAHDVRQFDGTRARLEARLGPPSDALPGDDTLKLAVWRFPKAALTLRWESRTPSLLVSVDRDGPPAFVFRR
jgi:hypothetical protein